MHVHHQQWGRGKWPCNTGRYRLAHRASARTRCPNFQDTKERYPHSHARRREQPSFSFLDREHRWRERERERVSRKAFSCFSLWSVTGTWRGESVIRNNNSTFHGKEKFLWEGGGLLAYLRLHLIARFVHCSFRLSLPSPCFVLFPRRGEHLLRNFVRKGEGFRSPYFFSFRFFLLLPFQRLERWRNSNREGILREI